jgi:ribosomal protein L37AE/L43A
VDVYTVICRVQSGEAFKIHLLAEDESDAARLAKKRGHDVDQVMPLYGSGQQPRWATGKKVAKTVDRSRCPACGYSLRGLPIEDGVITCPECGKRTALTR